MLIEEDRMVSELTHNQRRALAYLSDAPRTRNELAIAMRCSGSCAVSTLRVLKRKGLITEVGSRSTDGRRAPIYAPKRKHPHPPARELVGANGRTPYRLRSIVAALKGGPLTLEEIAGWIGCKQSQVSVAITYHRDGGRKSDVIRIADWYYSSVIGVGWAPLYGLGPGPDARKPKRDKKLVDAAYRERNKARIRVQQGARQQKAKGRAVKVADPFAHLLFVARGACKELEPA